MPPRRERTWSNRLALGVAVSVALAACSAGAASGPDSRTAEPGTSSSTSGPTGPSGTASAGPTSTTPSPPPTEDAAQRVLDRMTLAQQVGQLIMVGGQASGVSDATLEAISRYHVGNAMLTGRSDAGVTATARVSASLQRRATGDATAGIPLLVATDQEGGLVQVLSGSGFSDIPAALTQGGWSAGTLQARARAWGEQLRAAGVRVDLAPVADTVPAGTESLNAPVGRFDRQFGADPAAVAEDVVAFVRGMDRAGVVTTPKHFPGLGRVRGNTDTTAGVTDDVTTRASGYLDPWRRAIAAGAQVVMVSTAIYSRIDAGRPAAFSDAVITDLLRDHLGFNGVVISDDLGRAAQVQRWSPGSRAVQLIEAGGDLVLTVDPAQAPAMAGALLSRARASTTFRAQVRASALRVLQLKGSLGLLP